MASELTNRFELLESGQGDFPDKEFDEVASELITSVDYEGYEFITNYEIDNIRCTMHRKYREDSGLYQYKLWGHMMDVSVEACSHSYVDLEFRNYWDDYCVEAVRKEDPDTKKTAYYWQLNYPFPLSNRDYCFVRESRKLCKDERTIYVTLARSEPFQIFPERSGVIRVKDYFQKAAMMSDGKIGTIAYMTYYDNPQGMIPTWLINWAASIGGPQYLKVMHKSCSQYFEWREAVDKNKMIQTDKEI
ncbi:hypothetical protein LOD99_2548 [Oopsacas minuta]|uniref:Phosphatidylcholine transfer protein n=1 Tax=Oopsacas minuta TaxID=111878 RepID=A0AAV7K2H4_9METZ|nr:hypothetical protein LOD99_2548 [Oopsacas minuta]